MTPKLSIIVPVYNVEHFIHKCISSILEQTFSDFELILINDGSTDLSGEICDEYKSKDQRIRVFHKKNGGPSSARNLGIKISKGEYIAFVDSDDIVEKKMYEKLYNIALNEDAMIVACGYIEIDSFTGLTRESIKPLGNKLVIEGREIKRSLESFLSRNKILGYASLCNKIYKKGLIIDNQLVLNENIKIAEDLCFNIEAILHTNKICAVNEALYKYIRANTESIMNKRVGTFYLHLNARREILKTLEINQIDDEVYNKCARYENCKTVAEYLEQIKSVLVSKIPINKKVLRIYRLIHENYFLSSLKFFSSEYLGMKAKILVSMIKVLLFTERQFKVVKFKRG